MKKIYTRCKLKEKIEIYRTRDFPLTSEFTYLNNAAVGLIPNSTIEAINRFNEYYLHEPPYKFVYDRYLEMSETTRDIFARLINAKKNEISFQQNTSAGLNIVAEMLEWKKGDNVITTDLDYPSDIYPFLKLQKFGVNTKIIKNKNGFIDIADIERAIDDKTRLVSISWVSFANGFKQNIEKIGKLTKENGIYFLVDAIQGLGYLDIDVKKCKIDFLCSGNFKWLMAPFGAAEFYCEESLLEEFESPHVGWFSVEKPFEFKINGYSEARTARKFEPGNLCYPSIYGLKESLNYIYNIGMRNIRNRILRIGDILIEGLKRIGGQILSPLDERHRSAIIFSYFKEISGEKLENALQKERIIVGARRFGERNGIRISPSFYNTEEEIESLIMNISKIIKR